MISMKMSKKSINNQTVNLWITKNINNYLINTNKNQIISKKDKKTSEKTQNSKKKSSPNLLQKKTAEISSTQKNQKIKEYKNNNNKIPKFYNKHNQLQCKNNQDPQ